MLFKGAFKHTCMRRLCHLCVSLDVRRSPGYLVLHGNDKISNQKLMSWKKKKDDCGMRHSVELCPSQDSSKFLTQEEVGCTWFIALLWWTAPCHILMSQSLLGLKTARPCKPSDSWCYRMHETDNRASKVAGLSHMISTKTLCANRKPVHFCDKGPKSYGWNNPKIQGSNPKRNLGQNEETQLTQVITIKPFFFLP